MKPGKDSNEEIGEKELIQHIVTPNGLLIIADTKGKELYDVYRELGESGVSLPNWKNRGKGNKER